MDILYRRFALVVAIIATMGVMTANLIQETRTARSDRIDFIQQSLPASSGKCQGMKFCGLLPVAYVNGRAFRA